MKGILPFIIKVDVYAGFFILIAFFIKYTKKQELDIDVTAVLIRDPVFHLPNKNVLSQFDHHLKLKEKIYLLTARRDPLHPIKFWQYCRRDGVCLYDRAD